MKFIQHEIPIYTDIIFHLAEGTADELEVWYKEHITDDEPLGMSKCRGMCAIASPDQTHCFVMINSELCGTDNKPKIQTVCHEIFHATVNILEAKGVKFDVNNDEAYAYLYDYLIGLWWAFDNQNS